MKPDEEKWNRYLRLKTDSLGCPFCHHSDWSVFSNRAVLTNSFAEELIDGLKSISDDDKSIDEKSYSSPLDSLTFVKCNHCGYMAFFDQAMIDAALKDDPKNGK